MKLALNVWTTAILIGSTAAASAAAVTPLPEYDWTGFYAGVPWNHSELQQDYAEPPGEGQVFEGLDHDFTDEEAAFSGGLVLGYNLKASNPAWGLRDITDLERTALASGLRLCETVAMPANNTLLVFRRAA